VGRFRGSAGGAIFTHRNEKRRPVAGAIVKKKTGIAQPPACKSQRLFQLRMEKKINEGGADGGEVGSLRGGTRGRGGRRFQKKVF